MSFKLAIHITSNFLLDLSINLTSLTTSDPWVTKTPFLPYKLSKSLCCFEF